jgi:hypothetical protein
MLLMSFTGYRRSRRSVQRAVADFLIIRLCCEAFGALQKNAENLIGAALGPSAEPPTESGKAGWAGAGSISLKKIA